MENIERLLDEIVERMQIMEEKVDKIDEVSQELQEYNFVLNSLSVITIKNLYEEEIESSNGKLSHLKNDKKVVKFFDDIVKEFEDEYVSDEDEVEFKQQKVNK